MQPFADLDDLAPMTGSVFSIDTTPRGPAVDDEMTTIGSSRESEPESIETDRRQDLSVPGMFGGGEVRGFEDEVAGLPGAVTATGHWHQGAFCTERFENGT